MLSHWRHEVFVEQELDTELPMVGLRHFWLHSVSLWPWHLTSDLDDLFNYADSHTEHFLRVSFEIHPPNKEILCHANFLNGQTNGRLDRQPENIMPPHTYLTMSQILLVSCEVFYAQSLETWGVCGTGTWHRAANGRQTHNNSDYAWYPTLLSGRGWSHQSCGAWTWCRQNHWRNIWL